MPIDQGGDPLGRTNYVGCAGKMGRTNHPIEDRWRGVFTNRSKNTFSSIKDGSSNVILFGEALGGNDPADPENGNRFFSHAWMASPPNVVHWGIAKGSFVQFDSRHPGVVQVALADGAVRSLQKTTDLETLWRLGGMRDGNPVDQSKL